MKYNITRNKCRFIYIYMLHKEFKIKYIDKTFEGIVSNEYSVIMAKIQ